MRSALRPRAQPLALVRVERLVGPQDDGVGVQRARLVLCHPRLDR